MSEKRFYVYQYLTEDGIPYYIGKGSGDRIRAKHLVEVPPIERRVIIKDNLTDDEAKTLEKELITKYGRKVDGGILDNTKINQWACFTGWKHSAEAVQRIKDGNSGKKRTEEHKEHYRGPKTKDHAENIRSAVKQLWADPEYRAKRKAQMMATRIKNGHSNG